MSDPSRLQLHTIAKAPSLSLSLRKTIPTTTQPTDQNHASTTRSQKTTLPKETPSNPLPLHPFRHPIFQIPTRDKHRDFPPKSIIRSTARANHSRPARPIQPTRHPHPPKSNPPRRSTALHPRRNEPARQIETRKSNRSASNPQCPATAPRCCCCCCCHFHPKLRRRSLAECDEEGVLEGHGHQCAVPMQLVARWGGSRAKRVS